MPAAAAGNLFPYKISRPKLSQGSKKTEMIQLFLDHYRTVNVMVAAAGGTGRSGSHISSNGCGMRAAMVPTMPSAAYGYLETRLNVLTTERFCNELFHSSNPSKVRFMK